MARKAGYNLKGWATKPGGPPLRPMLEVAAVIATGGLHLVFINALNARAAFIGLSIAAWTAYIAARIRKDPSSLLVWGFSRRNLRNTLIATTVAAILAGAIMAVDAFSKGALRLQWHMLPLLLLYPMWGLIQQFLVQALVAANLNVDSRVMGSTWIITPFCALLFGIVHLPDLKLAAATFLLGLTFTPIYLKWRNLWPLGIYHGWLGVLFYFWILRRDPWLEVFGRF